MVLARDREGAAMSAAKVKAVTREIRFTDKHNWAKGLRLDPLINEQLAMMRFVDQDGNTLGSLWSRVSVPELLALANAAMLIALELDGEQARAILEAQLQLDISNVNNAREAGL